jgi:hypothetical protein
MNFLKVIFDNSELNEAKLYAPAQKCFNRPDTGITIQHKGAYNVIKDCAKITIRYLPHYIFASYTNPFKTLSGKFTKLDIEEFVKSSRDDFALNQLLIIIKEKYKLENDGFSKLDEVTVIVENDVDTNDPYGYYGMNDSTQTVKEKKKTDIDLLCEIFSVE